MRTTLVGGESRLAVCTCNEHRMLYLMLNSKRRTFSSLKINICALVSKSQLSTLLEQLLESKASNIHGNFLSHRAGFVYALDREDTDTNKNVALQDVDFLILLMSLAANLSVGESSSDWLGRRNDL